MEHLKAMIFCVIALSGKTKDISLLQENECCVVLEVLLIELSYCCCFFAYLICSTCQPG